MEKCTFRRAEATDYKQVNNLQKELLEYHKNLAPNTYCNVFCEDYDFEDFLAEISDNDKAWFVAECEGKIVGTVLGYITANRYNQIYCFVDSLYVVPLFRGRGVATNLLKKVEELARKNSVDSIQIDVCATNIGATEFYENLGAKPVQYTLEKKISEVENE